jgi:hypothetical protein
MEASAQAVIYVHGGCHSAIPANGANASTAARERLPHGVFVGMLSSVGKTVSLGFVHGQVRGHLP